MAPGSPSRASRPRARGEARRDEIVRVAIDVFGQAGFAGARVDEVARRVGIRRPSVLYHFPDKRSLYTASIADVVRDIEDRVRATASRPGEPLDAMADAWVDFVIDRPNAARLILRQLIDAPAVPMPEIVFAVQELFTVVQAAIEAQAGPEVAKQLDASELSLILSSTSLVWVAGQSAVEGAFGLDTLSPQALQRHRRMLHALVRQLLTASDEADQPRPGVPAPGPPFSPAGSFPPAVDSTRRP